MIERLRASSAASTIKTMLNRDRPTSNTASSAGGWGAAQVFGFAGAVLREAFAMAWRNLRKLLLVAAVVGVTEMMSGPLEVTNPAAVTGFRFGVPVLAAIAGAVWLSRDPQTASGPHLAVGGISFGFAALVVVHVIWMTSGLALLWAGLWLVWRIFLGRVVPVSVGEVFWANVDFEDGDGSKVRPVLVVGKRGSKVEVLPITSKEHRAGQAGYIEVSRKGWDRSPGRSFVNCRRRLTMSRFDLQDSAGMMRWRDWRQVTRSV